MTRTEHLIENALLAVTNGKSIEEFVESELTHGYNCPSQILDMVYEMAIYVHYTWNEGRTVDDSTIEIRAGDRFTYRGVEYVCLEVFDKEVYGSRAALVVATKIIKTMKFAEKHEDGCNDWRKSKVREWLNDEFLAMHISKDDVLPQTSNLVADNGDNAYGTSEDLVTLLSCDQCRKYRKLMPKYNDWVWTVTPYSCNSVYAHVVRCISPSGELSHYGVTNCRGVAPACLFNLEKLQSKPQTHYTVKHSEEV